VKRLAQNIEFLKWRIRELQEDVARIDEQIAMCEHLPSNYADDQSREVSMFLSWKDQAERLIADRQRELDETSDET